MLFTRNGIMNMKNEKWKNDFSPLDESGNFTLIHFIVKAYVRHLLWQAKGWLVRLQAYTIWHFIYG